MRYIKTFGLIILCMVLFSACGKEKEIVNDSEIENNLYWGHNALEYNGVTYMTNNGYLCYLNLESGKKYPLCAKVNCNHKGGDCNAYFGNGLGFNMVVYNEKLYIDSYTDNYVPVIYRINLDGTDREMVINLSEFIEGLQLNSYNLSYIFSQEHLYINLDSTRMDGSSYQAWYHCNMFEQTYESILEGDEAKNLELFGTCQGKLYLAQKLGPVKYKDGKSYDPDSKEWIVYGAGCILYDDGEKQYVIEDGNTYIRDIATGKMEKAVDGYAAGVTSKYIITSRCQGEIIATASSPEEEGIYVYDLEGKEVVFVEATEEMKADQYGFGVSEVTTSAIWIVLMDKGKVYGYILFDEIEAGNPEIHLIHNN